MDFTNGERILTSSHMHDGAIFYKKDSEYKIPYVVNGHSSTKVQYYEYNIGRDRIITCSSVAFVEPTDTTIALVVNEYNKYFDDFIDSDSGLYGMEATYNLIVSIYPETETMLKTRKCSCCGHKSFHLCSIDGKYFCSDCYAERFVRCSHCGGNSKKEEAEECRDGNWLCPSCKKRLFVIPYHRYYPKVKFYGKNEDNGAPFMGFELEVDEGGESSKNVASLMPKLNKENDMFAYCSHDSSLNDGFEIITQPATIEYHNSLKSVYANAFQFLKSEQYSSHDTTSCGFHVHFNRSYFGEKEEVCISKLLYLSEKFWDELVVFARRPERRMARYAKKIAPMEISEYIREANKSGEHDFHYYAVNLANRDTIEFRMFRGTLNVNTVLATLQLVNNMVVASKEKTIEELKDMRFEELLTTKSQKAYWKRRIAILDTEE